MRYVYLFLFFAILTGCAHNKIRLHKVEKRDSVEIAEAKKEKSSYKKDNSTQKVIDVSTSESLVQESTNEPEYRAESKDVEASYAPEAVVSASNANTLENIDEEPSKNQKVREALMAESDARKAKNAFIWSLSMFFLFFIPLVPLFSIIPFIIGSIKLNQSNKSDYITLEGEKEARSARIMQLIYAVLAGLTLLAITIILMVLFL